MTNSTPNKFTFLLSSVAIFFASLVLATSIFASAYMIKEGNAFTNKSLAVQGCYEVAQSKKITQGKSDNNGTWTVEDADVNQKVIDSCLQQKGY